jgi:dTDP-4-dehydrorhamnose reductase
VKKILVLGASGFIGSYIFNYFKSSGEYRVIGTYYKNPPIELPNEEKSLFYYFDKTNLKTFEKIFFDLRPDIIVDASYETNLDKCEVDSTCELLNIDGTKNVIEAVKKNHAVLVFISSDCVFDGENGPYSEEDLPNPVSRYGRQKLESEKLIERELENFLIVRVCTVYGYKNGSRNPLQILKESAKSGKLLQYVNDQWVTPTYVEDIPKGLEILIKNQLKGVWHISSGQFMNRFDFVKKLAESFNISVKIEPITTTERDDKAKRPKKGGLKIEKIKSLGFTPKLL